MLLGVLPLICQKHNIYSEPGGNRDYFNDQPKLSIMWRPVKQVIESKAPRLPPAFSNAVRTEINESFLMWNVRRLTSNDR